jgi:hypothetical protein
LKRQNQIGLLKAILLVLLLLALTCVAVYLKRFGSTVRREDILVSESEFDFGTIDCTQTLTHTFTIENKTGRSISIRQLGVDCNCMTITKVDRIRALGIEDVTLTLRTDNRRGFNEFCGHIFPENGDFSIDLCLKFFGQPACDAVPARLSIDLSDSSTKNDIGFLLIASVKDVNGLAAALPSLSSNAAGINPIIQKVSFDRVVSNGLRKIQYDCVCRIDQNAFSADVRRKIDGLITVSGLPNQSTELGIPVTLYRVNSIQLSGPEVITLSRSSPRTTSVSLWSAQKTPVVLQKIEVSNQLINVRAKPQDSQVTSIELEIEVGDQLWSSIKPGHIEKIRVWAVGETRFPFEFEVRLIP